MDRHTGKTKKHKACASEFDYLGWEDFGTWKRKAAGCHSPMEKLLDKPAFKHCERQCVFPSACHWKAKHAPRKEATFFEILDAKSQYLGSRSSKISPSPEKEEATSNPKKTGLYVNRLVRAADKRTTQLTTLLSTIEDESNFASTPGFIPASTDIAPKLPELNLSFPVMDFSAIKQGLDDHQKETKAASLPKLVAPKSPPPHNMSGLIEAVAEESPNFFMTDWLSEDPTTSDLMKTGPDTSNIDFDFSIDTSTSPSSSPSTGDESPDSRGRAWDWTAGDIGIALSSPLEKAVHDQIWDEQLDDIEGMWEKAVIVGSKREGEVEV